MTYQLSFGEPPLKVHLPSFSTMGQITHPTSHHG
jgi:hypothetical protein